MSPPGFVIAKNPQAGEEENLLQFTADSNERLYLKPEEVGRAVVSEPFHFDPSYISNGIWSDSNVRIKFSDCLMNVIQPNCGTNRQQKEMRLVLCRPSDYIDTNSYSDTDDENEEHERRPDLFDVPMKLKLVPNLINSESKNEKELSYITRLANCFGHQNLRMTLEEDGGAREPLDITFLKSVDFTWNQQDLTWEAETQVKFSIQRGSDYDFGETYEQFVAYFPKITVLLKGAVSTLLNQQFGLYRNNEHVLRTLEEEVNTDLIINDKHGNSVNCHRFPLMSTSAQFVNMLNETRTWKEASNRTINLDLNKDAIMAMLHFIYYGGTDRIVSGSATQAMDLLQFGHMYEMQELVEVTSLVLMHKADTSFTLDEAWELFRYSGGMMELEENSRWKELKEMAGDIVKKCRLYNYEKMKASELYKKLYPIAENLGPAFVAFLNKTTCTSADAKALPINLKEVSMEDCRLFLEYISVSASFDYYSKDLDADLGLGFLLLVEHTQCKQIYWAHLKALLNLVSMRPNTWFKVDHLVALFTLFWEIKEPSPELSKLMLAFARKLMWFVLNRHDEALESINFQEMFKNNWACAMGFTRLCIQNSPL